MPNPSDYSPRLPLSHSSGFGSESWPFRMGWATQMDEEDFKARSDIFSKCLLGAFVDVRSFDEIFVCNKIRSICNLEGPVAAEKYGSYFIFKFNSEEDKKVVFQFSPLQIDGGFLVTKECSPSLLDSDLRMGPVGIWVQAHGVPLIHQTNHTAFLLAAHVGSLLDIDWIPDGRLTSEKGYLRFKVVIYPSDPLVSGSYIPMGNNSFVWVHFSYEKVGKVCLRCGRIGHSAMQCKFPHPSVEADLRKSFVQAKQFAGQKFLCEGDLDLFTRDIVGKKVKTDNPMGIYDQFISFEEDNVNNSSSDSSSFHTESGSPLSTRGVVGEKQPFVVCETSNLSVEKNSEAHENAFGLGSTSLEGMAVKPTDHPIATPLTPLSPKGKLGLAVDPRPSKADKIALSSAPPRKRKLSTSELGGKYNKKKGKSKSAPSSADLNNVTPVHRTKSVPVCSSFTLPLVFEDFIDVVDGTLFDPNGVWSAAPPQPPEQS